MKKNMYSLMIIAVAGLSSFAMAQRTTGEANSGRQKMMLERFDTDKDGKLSETEREALRSAMQTKKGDRGKTTVE